MAVSQAEYKTLKTQVLPHKPGHKHNGKTAALVVSNKGFRAWGFGDCEQSARKDAISKIVRMG